MPDSRVTIHMAASLDGFIARKDGRVDWMETSDEFAAARRCCDHRLVDAFLKTIDCYVMGSRTYETALAFRGEGIRLGIRRQADLRLTTRDLPRTRDTVEFHSGDLTRLVNERLRPGFATSGLSGAARSRANASVAGWLTRFAIRFSPC